MRFGASFRNPEMEDENCLNTSKFEQKVSNVVQILVLATPFL